MFVCYKPQRKLTLWKRIFPLSGFGSVSPEITSRSSMSLSPLRKSSSIFSMAVPAFRKWLLHQAVNVLGRDVPEKREKHFSINATSSSKTRWMHMAWWEKKNQQLRNCSILHYYFYIFAIILCLYIFWNFFPLPILVFLFLSFHFINLFIHTVMWPWKLHQWTPFPFPFKPKSVKR